MLKLHYYFHLQFWFLAKMAFRIYHPLQLISFLITLTFLKHFSQIFFSYLYQFINFLLIQFLELYYLTNFIHQDLFYCFQSFHLKAAANWDQNCDLRFDQQLFEGYFNLNLYLFSKLNSRMNLKKCLLNFLFHLWLD